jgi:hypothetical protein
MSVTSDPLVWRLRWSNFGCTWRWPVCELSTLASRVKQGVPLVTEKTWLGIWRRGERPQARGTLRHIASVLERLILRARGTTLERDALTFQWLMDLHGPKTKPGIGASPLGPSDHLNEERYAALPNLK